MRALLPALLLLLGAVPEQEPDGYTVIPPQPLGVLADAGIDLTGTLDPTSPSGLEPGDQDGFSFTVDGASPFAATVDGGPGAAFLLALGREEPGGGLAPLAAVMGAAPLTLAVPALEAGPTYRIGVAAMADGSPLAYSLALRKESALPPWTGEICAAPAAAAEPDDDPLRGTDLGYFTGVLCASGSLGSVVPPGGEGTGDADAFRFRNVLPVPARVRFTAAPGLLRVEAQAVVFVGLLPFASTSFGEEGTLDLPVLAPGSEYVLRVAADPGEAPLDYSFVLEPVAPPPPPDPEPVTVVRGRLRLDTDGGRESFSLDGAFAPGTGLALGPDAPFAWSLRGAGQEFASGLLTRDGKGRLVYRGLPGAAGLRSLRFDPVAGRLRLRGKGLGFARDPGDPALDLRLTLGDLVLGADAEGEFRSGGRVLVVRAAE